ncbi:MAG: hypothetical protein WC958_04140 [Dehalococcoidales bacterium]
MKKEGRYFGLVMLKIEKLSNGGIPLLFTPSSLFKLSATYNNVFARGGPLVSDVAISKEFDLYEIASLRSQRQGVFQPFVVSLSNHNGRRIVSPLLSRS